MVTVDDSQRVRNLLKGTIVSMVKGALKYKTHVSVEGCLGVTIDDETIFMISINEVVSQSGSTTSKTSGAGAAPQRMCRPPARRQLALPAPPGASPRAAPASFAPPQMRSVPARGRGGMIRGRGQAMRGGFARYNVGRPRLNVPGAAVRLRGARPVARGAPAGRGGMQRVPGQRLGLLAPVVKREPTIPGGQGTRPRLAIMQSPGNQPVRHTTPGSRPMLALPSPVVRQTTPRGPRPSPSGARPMLAIGASPNTPQLRQVTPTAVRPQVKPVISSGSPAMRQTTPGRPALAIGYTQSPQQGQPISGRTPVPRTMGPSPQQPRVAGTPVVVRAFGQQQSPQTVIRTPAGLGGTPVIRSIQPSPQQARLPAQQQQLQLGSPFIQQSVPAARVVTPKQRPAQSIGTPRQTASSVQSSQGVRLATIPASQSPQVSITPLRLGFTNTD